MVAVGHLLIEVAAQIIRNMRSVGIELEGCDEMPFEDAQYAVLLDLVRRLCAHYPIDAVVGHSDISPGRKTDPGPCFDWRRLALIGDLPGTFR